METQVTKEQAVIDLKAIRDKLIAGNAFLVGEEDEVSKAYADWVLDMYNSFIHECFGIETGFNNCEVQYDK
jgi:hypothetical protein